MCHLHSGRRDTENKVSDLPNEAVEALRSAMVKEGTPESWFDDLAWIMAQVSGGRLDAFDPGSTARGLFQLTEVDCTLLPLGKASWGDPIEEAQGGIRYIRQRYASARAARDFWQQHHYC